MKINAKIRFEKVMQKTLNNIETGSQKRGNNRGKLRKIEARKTSKKEVVTSRKHVSKEQPFGTDKGGLGGSGFHPLRRKKKQAREHADRSKSTPRPTRLSGASGPGPNFDRFLDSFRRMATSEEIPDAKQDT